MTWATRLLGKAARSLLAWAERSADPMEREWVQAMRAELDLIDGARAQLGWAAGVLPLVWRAYRVDILRCMVCVAAVVGANYAYPRYATGPEDLFFFAQQLYLPVVGILAAQATRRLLPGTLIGVGLSLFGFAVVHAFSYGSWSAPTALATGGHDYQMFDVFVMVGSQWVNAIYVQIPFFAIVGAAFGTLGATAGLWTSRRAVTT